MSSSALAAGLRQLRGKLAAQQHNDDSDEQLLHAFLANGDENAFAALVRRHGPMVLHLCRRVLGHEQDAEDAFQATFLVLSRQASKLRKKASLASWLHGIAYRISLKAKQAAARRRKHEGRASPRSSAEPSAELLWHEVRALLDDEIGRLPEKYRSVFVLFYLEDCGREETALRLGLKEGTAASRLDKARKWLARRLAQRGVELTAVLAASAVATQSAPALSPVLISTTIKAALADGAAGLVSLPVAGLVKGATSALMLSKMKVAAMFLVVATLFSGVGLCFLVKPQAALTPPAEPAAANGKTGDKAASSQSAAAKRMEIQGRVLGPDGKPKAAAKILLFGYEDQRTTELGVSASDGCFTVVVPKKARDYSLLAQAAGTGIGFLNLHDRKPATPVEFRLVKDQVIRGRVVNTEGKPIAGVRVAINSINTYPKNSLDSFLAMWKQRDPSSQMPWGEKAFWSKAGTLLPTRTDSDGRFALHGAGAERLVSLRLHGAGIAETELWIINREGFDPEPYNRATRRNIPKEFEIAVRWMLHGPNLSFVADAEKPLRGVVKDADSGKGRPNVVVHMSCVDQEQHWEVHLRAITDTAGHFEMHGVHKAKKYMLEVEADASAGYMPCQVWADDTTGYEPISVVIPVKKGVIITGEVIDQATGRSVPGFVEAGVLVNNPFAKAYPRFNSSRLGKLNFTADDGTFRIVTVPGPVLLMGGLAYGRMPGGLLEKMKYKPVAPDPKYPQYFLKRSENRFLEYSNFEEGSAPVEGEYCKVLHIKPGTEVLKEDIILERASALPITIQDAEGSPLTGVWATGIGSELWRFVAIRIENDNCAAYHLKAGKPRLMVLYHPGRKLAGSLILKGDEQPPVVLKLAPTGAIKGRLHDADGKPLAGVVVKVGYPDREADEIDRVIHKAKLNMTDAEGRVTLDELIPERAFFVTAIRRGKQLFEEGSKPRNPILREVKSGECRDLGALKLK
jgi:RNA polymerase sigma factor (sigma-70 family)